MKEKPRMIVASGTRDARVLERLNMSRQTKMMITRAMQIRTASSFATIESTSWNGDEF